jgi:hypothetical protein
MSSSPLWDAHVACAGYRESPLAGDAASPYRTILELLAQARVTGCLQLGVPIESLYALGEPLAGASVAVNRAGAWLDGQLEGFRLTRLCRDEAAVRRSVQAFAFEGLDAVACGAGLDPRLATLAVREAADRDLTCVLEAGPGTAAVLGSVTPASVHGLLGLVADGNGRLPACEQVARLAETDRELLRSRIEPALERRVAIAPLLLRLRRSIVLEEAIAAPGLEQLTAILPYHRHLIELRSPAALRFGRKHINRYLGFPKLDRTQRARFDRGWDALLEVLVEVAQRGGMLVGASGAPDIGLCPGIALREEAQLWLAAGVDAETTQAAFGAPAVLREQVAS